MVRRYCVDPHTSEDRDRELNSPEESRLKIIRRVFKVREIYLTIKTLTLRRSIDQTEGVFGNSRVTRLYQRIQIENTLVLVALRTVYFSRVYLTLN